MSLSTAESKNIISIFLRAVTQARQAPYRIIDQSAEEQVQTNIDNLE